MLRPPLFGILTVLFACTSWPAFADCESSLYTAKTVASGVSVRIASPTPARAGVPIKISWSKRSASHPDMPTYIVISAPPQVRFGGTGFMALAANAVGPNQMQYAKAQSRALIAIYRPNDTASDGEIAITPFISGPQVYGWAIVAAGSCGEHVLAEGGRRIDVDVGAATLVVQNRYIVDNPTQRLRSRDGTHELFIFNDHFEVRDVATNSVLTTQTGTNVNFSPTGRFVAWQQSDGFYSILDLVSERLVATDVAQGFLAWARQDSYVISGGTSWGEVTIKNVLVDDSNVLAANTSCHACDAWTNVQTVLDFDRGFALARGTDGWKVEDLFAPSGSTSLDVDGTDLNEALGLIRRTYDRNYPAIPKVWSLGERLALSHLENSDNSRAQAKFLVQHIPQAVTPTITASRAGGDELIGRAMAGNLGTIEEIKTGTQSDQAFSSLVRYGVRTTSLAPLEHYAATYNANYERTDDLAVRIGAIGARVAEAQRIFVKPPDYDSRCGLGTHADSHFDIDPADVVDIWHWRRPGGDSWLVLSEYSEGSGAFPQACAVLLREGSSRPVTLLSPDDLSIESASGQNINLRVFRVSDALIAIASQVTDRINGIRLFDDAGNAVGKLIPVVDGKMLADIRLTQDGKNLVQINKDGRFFVFRVADGRLELQGSYIDSEIVIMAADGHYETSYEGDESVQVRFAGMSGLFTVNQFEAALRKRGLAKDVLEGNWAPSDSPSVLAPPSAQLTLSAHPSAGHRIGKVIANSDRGLSAIHIHVDGRLIASIPVQGPHAEVPVDLPDPGGGRWVSAIAVDTGGLVSLPSSIKLPGPVRPRGVARVIAIGVDKYVDPSIPGLESTKLDARHFAEAVASAQGRAFSSVQTSVLVDADVTHDSVLNAVRTAVNETGEDDTIVFFFAGHGVDGARVDQPGAGLVLATNRTLVSDLANTAVSWTALADILSASKGTVIVFVDACQSGIAGREAFGTNDDVVSALFTKSGSPIIVLAASKGRQFSQEIAHGGGGRFTNAVVAALKNERSRYDRDHGGLIDLGALYSGVRERVERESYDTQTPWLARNRLVGEMSLF